MKSIPYSFLGRISQDSVESDDEMEDMTSSQTDSKKKRMPTEENVEK